MEATLTVRHEAILLPMQTFEPTFMKAQKCPMHAHIQILKSAGADPGFSEGGGSESGVDIEGGANPSIVSLKQGVWVS